MKIIRRHAFTALGGACEQFAIGVDDASLADGEAWIRHILTT